MFTVDKREFANILVEGEDGEMSPFETLTVDERFKDSPVDFLYSLKQTARKVYAIDPDIKLSFLKQTAEKGEFCDEVDCIMIFTPLGLFPLYYNEKDHLMIITSKEDYPLEMWYKMPR